MAGFQLDSDFLWRAEFLLLNNVRNIASHLYFFWSRNSDEDCLDTKMNQSTEYFDHFGPSCKEKILFEVVKI